MVTVIQNFTKRVDSTMDYDSVDDRDSIYEYGSEQGILKAWMNNEFRAHDPPPGLLQGHRQFASLVPLIRQVTETSPSWRALPYTLEHARSMRDVLKALKRGVVVENDAPYEAELVNVRPSPEAMERAVPLHITYMRVHANIDQLKGCIMSGYPVLFAYIGGEDGGPLLLPPPLPGHQQAPDAEGAAAGGAPAAAPPLPPLHRPLAPALSKRGYMVEVLIGFNDADGAFIASDPFHYTGIHLIPYGDLCSLECRTGRRLEGKAPDGNVAVGNAAAGPRQPLEALGVALDHQAGVAAAREDGGRAAADGAHPPPPPPRDVKEYDFWCII